MIWTQCADGYYYKDLSFESAIGDKGFLYLGCEDTLYYHGDLRDICRVFPFSVVDEPWNDSGIIGGEYGKCKCATIGLVGLLDLKGGSFDHHGKCWEQPDDATCLDKPVTLAMNVAGRGVINVTMDGRDCASFRYGLSRSRRVSVL